MRYEGLSDLSEPNPQTLRWRPHAALLTRTVEATRPFRRIGSSAPPPCADRSPAGDWERVGCGGTVVMVVVAVAGVVVMAAAAAAAGGGDQVVITVAAAVAVPVSETPTQSWISA